jgi:hypothetical protein
LHNSNIATGLRGAEYRPRSRSGITGPEAPHVLPEHDRAYGSRMSSADAGVRMGGRSPWKRAQRWIAVVSAALPLTSAAAFGNPAETSAAPESAVWVPKVLTFTYQGFTTKYTCDALWTKMKQILLELGARPDLQVRTWGCTEPVAPDIFPGVTVQMNVLQPGASGAQAVAAHWKKVNLLANRNPVEAAADCELISQIKLRVLPLFAARNVDYSATCARGQPVPGSTRLTADVLVADSSPATASR